MQKIFILIITLTFAIGGCATSSNHFVNTNGVPANANVHGVIYINEIEDLTAGRAFDPAIDQEIIDSLKNRIKNSNKYRLANSKTDANYILNIKMIQFTAGNRAARFWVGFGAGSAKLTFICELFDLEGNLLAHRKFQRFGAASLRSGYSIILKMKELVIYYTSNWLNI